MGQTNSTSDRTAAHLTLSDILPPLQKMEYNESWMSVDKGWKVFSDVQDRDHFIDALLTVATGNGALSLPDLVRNHSFKLLYSRQPVDGSAHKTVAALVAIDDNGTVRAKIEPKEGGVDQREAFVKFREHVEVRLGEILRDVRGEMGGRAKDEAPPSYGEVGGKKA